MQEQNPALQSSETAPSERKDEAKTNPFEKILRIEKYLLILIIIAIFSFAIQVYFVSQIKFIGTSDPAHYVEAAENVVLGKGFVMDYINQYFVKFDTLTHPEEYTFPGASLLMIPSILLLGKTAFATKLPSMIIGILFFPILIYYLGRDFFNERIGFLAAVTFMFNSLIFPMSFGGERDTVFAFFVVSAVYFFYKGIQNDKLKWFLLMGFFLGFSYLIRQSSMILIPTFAIAYYYINKKIARNLLYGIGFCLAIMAPWMIRSYLIFGNPFFTVNKYIAWVMGYTSIFEQGGFDIYWDRQKPGFSFLLDALGPKMFLLNFGFRFFTNLVGQFASFFAITVLTFIGVAAWSGREISKRLSRWMAFLILFAIFGVIFNKFFLLPIKYNVWFNRTLIGLPYAGMILTMFLFFLKGKKENTVFVFTIAVYAFFFSVLWTGGERYWIAMVPFLLIYAWFAMERILQKIGEKIVKPPPTPEQIGKGLLIILAIFVLFSLPQTYGNFVKKDGTFPFKDYDFGNTRMYVAEKVKNVTPEDAVIMGCDVAVFHFYNGRKYLEFPAGDLERTVAVMKEYNASYFTILGCERRTIDANFYLHLFGEKVLLGEYYGEGQLGKANIPKEAKLMVYKVSFPEKINETDGRLFVVDEVK